MTAFAIESLAPGERFDRMKRLAFLLALGACTQSRSPTDERAPAPADPAPPPPAIAKQPPPQQQPPPPQQPLSEDELKRKLQELGKRRGAELRGPADRGDEIPALGPCQRPSADERAALRQRVLAWIEQSTAGFEHPAEEPAQLSLRFGCVEPAGIVIAAQMDRETKQRSRSHAPDVGHWWTLRATPASIAILSETRGLATLRYNAYDRKLFQETLALADLDGDGVLDPLVARIDRAGIALNAAIQLSVVGSRTNKRTAVAAFGDEVAPALVQGAGRSGPIVLEIADNFAAVRAFRCVGATLTLARCPEAAAARRSADALAVADQLAALSQIPDREGLAEWLDLLGAPRDVAEPLRAAASPTSPAERAARKIERFLHSIDDRTDAEREAAASREAAAPGAKQKLAAREVLASATPQALGDPAKREKFVRALEQLGAERALVDETSRVR